MAHVPAETSPHIHAQKDSTDRTQWAQKEREGDKERRGKLGGKTRGRAKERNKEGGIVEEIQEEFMGGRGML